MKKCDRCNREVPVLTGSYFDDKMICLSCEAKEESHPDYKRAKEVENQEVRKGNYNYPGIGLPRNF